MSLKSCTQDWNREHIQAGHYMSCCKYVVRGSRIDQYFFEELSTFQILYLNWSSQTSCVILQKFLIEHQWKTSTCLHIHVLHFYQVHNNTYMYLIAAGHAQLETEYSYHVCIKRMHHLLVHILFKTSSLELLFLFYTIYCNYNNCISMKWD